MRWVLPACALVLLAHAPEVAARECQQIHRVFPADGTTDVPMNTSVWVLGEEQDAYVLVDGVGERVLGGTSYWSSSRITQLALGVLAAKRTYTVKTIAGEHVTTFTTGNRVDSTPPDPPTIDNVRYEAGRLSISAVSNGSVAVWVTTQERLNRGLWAWQLFPSEGFTTAFGTCNQSDDHPEGSACVELRSMDSAGNLSRIVSNCTPIVGGSRYLPSIDAREAERDVKRELILIGLGVVAGLGLIVLRRWAATRRLHAATTSALVRADVMNWARELRRRMTLLVLACTGAFGFALVLPVATFDAWLPILVPVIAIAFFAAATAARTHRALALLEAASSKATTDGHFMFVVREGKLQTFLELGRLVSPSVTSTSIPKATARIND